jgi:ATP-dependent Clp protease ATP-binding subunit ClpA
MAKFDNHLKNSDLTWSDLKKETSSKIDSYENVYEAYTNAFEADDTKLINKYEKQLEKLDTEILSMIKSQESDSKSVSKPVEAKPVETKPVQDELKDWQKESIKAAEENKEEMPKDESGGISFWWD